MRRRRDPEQSAGVSTTWVVLSWNILQMNRNGASDKEIRQTATALAKLILERSEKDG